MKKIAISLVALNILVLVAGTYMGLRYRSQSRMAHESYIHALERAKLAGATNAIPKMNSDYVDSLREQNGYLLTGSVVGFGFVIIGNTLWILFNSKSHNAQGD